MRPTFGSPTTPPEGFNCDSVYIPGDIKVAATRYSLGRREILLGSLICVFLVTADLISFDISGS